MAIYNEILSWAGNKPAFIKDALRRIISSQTISESDIQELVLLVKKECGDSSVTLNAFPIDHTHIPSIAASGTDFPKLLSIKKPINICALHSDGNLEFQNSGLTVVYGNNGSGKSSYSRILKKLCWSRSSDNTLKKNVFAQSNERQRVDFVIKANGVDEDFRWEENSDSHSALQSIFVFDNECGDVYVNEENPSIYKPIGIDVLERLIPILNEISIKLNTEIVGYTTQKPLLAPTLGSTPTGLWYANIEAKSRTEIDTYIQFSQTNSDRKQELYDLINSQNPNQNIQNLTSLKGRIENYIRQFKRIEEQFNDASIQEIRNLRSRYENVKQAYDIITNELNGLNTIDGFGSNPWRTLWDAAKNFANSNGMTEDQSFPSGLSMEKCVLCQQDLDEAAQLRLQGFGRFIRNDVSNQLSSIEREIEQKITYYNNLVIAPFDNFNELVQYIIDFQNQYEGFNQEVSTSKTILINHLQNSGEFTVAVNSISTLIENLLPNIKIQLDQNNQLLNNRNALLVEYNELVAKQFVFNNKAMILQYFDEYKHKKWIGDCQAKLSTTFVSRKIGELMADQAVALQHQEFLDHLNYFNTNLASKVIISKTRTSQGNTFQRCSLNGISDSLDSILSEGERKIIALSNFLSECTIDNRKNTIVFDDPVTSMDMDNRDLIANKIVELSRDRQIIVLTHDLYFVRLLLDIHKRILREDCHILGVEKHRGVAGVVVDDIPYLAKNIQERINSVRRDLDIIDALPLNQIQRAEEITEKLKKQFRKLLEKTVEDILANDSIKRFSKNINLKAGYLSSFVITEHTDITFILDLFGKYSVTEHDGSIQVQSNQLQSTDIRNDLQRYETWKRDFATRLSTFKAANNYR